jgi:ribosomal protein L11 methyltransferase
VTGSAAQPSWKVEVIVPTAAGDAIASAVEGHISAVSMFPAPSGDAMRICGYVATEPDAAALETDIAAAAQTAGIAPPELCIACLPATDWAAVNRESFAPLRVGGFWIRDSYHDDPAPAGTATLIVDAATAFGTGHHPTTQGTGAGTGYGLRHRHSRHGGSIALAAPRRRHRHRSGRGGHGAL